MTTTFMWEGPQAKQDERHGKDQKSTDGQQSMLVDLVKRSGERCGHIAFSVAHASLIGQLGRTIDIRRHAARSNS